MNEKRLWVAVLDRAIIDPKQKKHRDSARFWFRNDKETGVGSFNWICEALGLNIEKTRAKVLG